MASHTWPRIVPCVLLAAITVPAVACHRTEPAASPPAPGGEHAHGGNTPSAAGPLDRLFRNFNAGYEPAPNFTALAQQSALVVTARLEQIREGRVYGGSTGDDARSEHLIHVFTVSHVLRGTYSGPRLFVETPKPGRQPASVYDAARPAGAEAVLYLIPRPESALGDTVDPGAGLDAGATAMWPTTPQGLLLMENGTVTHPMDATTPSSVLFDDERPDEHDVRSWLPADLRAVAGHDGP